jgi:2-dehydropantoate 2-reductase
MDGMRLPVVRLPGTPSHWLGFALRHLPAWSYRGFLARKVTRGRGGKPPSLHMDLAAQRGCSEVDFLNGAVVRHAKALGLAAPVNDGLAQLLGTIVSGETSWEAYRSNPDRLADRLLSGDF